MITEQPKGRHLSISNLRRAAGLFPPGDREAGATPPQPQRERPARRRRGPPQCRLPEQREQDGGEGKRWPGRHFAGAEEQPRRGDPAGTDRSVLIAAPLSSRDAALSSPFSRAFVEPVIT